MSQIDDQKTVIAKQALVDFLKDKLSSEDLTKASALIATYTANCVRAKVVAATRPKPAPDTASSLQQAVTDAFAAARASWDGVNDAFRS